jgi:hypothetical protein
MTDKEILALICSTFDGIERPAHFTNYKHCEECAEHEATMQARTPDTLAIEDVENPGWTPICFLTPEGFQYFMPGLIRLALTPGCEFFLMDMVGFFLSQPPGEHWQYKLFSTAQIEAIIKFLRHVLDTRCNDYDINSCWLKEADRNAVENWEAWRKSCTK